MNNESLKQLRDPLPAKEISWRVGSTNQEKTRGKALPYIDARVVQNRLDEVVQPGNWRNRYTEVVVDGKLLAVRCVIAIKVDGEWVEKEDAAHLDAIDNADRAEIAIKGVYSDALKRAAVQWGIGRYLYEFDAPWVELDEFGRLRMTPSLPNEMLPENERKAAAASTKKPEAKPAPAASPAPAPKAEAQPQPKAEVKAEPKAEPKTDETPAAQPAATAARDVLSPSGAAANDDEAERRVKADALADQAAAKPAPAPVPAPAPAPAPAAAPAPAPAAAAMDGEPALPEGISDEQRALVVELQEKMKKLPAHMIRSYINGPKGQEKFAPNVREYLLKVLAQREGAADAA